jgi:hypothetical protein
VHLSVLGRRGESIRDVRSETERSGGNSRLVESDADQRARDFHLRIEDPLTARGVVLFGAGQPIVLCAVDWIGIANGGHDAWRESLAQALSTSVDRVAVHALHHYDAVRCDFTAEELLAPHGLAGKRFNVPLLRRTIANAAQAAKAALEKAQPVSHLGVGQARVDKVASNRRIAYAQGGYETQPSSSNTTPQVERVLMDGMRSLLK